MQYRFDVSSCSSRSLEKNPGIRGKGKFSYEREKKKTFSDSNLFFFNSLWKVLHVSCVHIKGESV